MRFTKPITTETVNKYDAKCIVLCSTLSRTFRCTIFYVRLWFMKKSVFETTVCLMVFYQRFMALFTYGNMDYWTWRYAERITTTINAWHDFISSQHESKRCNMSPPKLYLWLLNWNKDEQWRWSSKDHCWGKFRP